MKPAKQVLLARILGMYLGVLLSVYTPVIITAAAQVD